MNTHVQHSGGSFVPVLKAIAGVSFLSLCAVTVLLPYLGAEHTLMTQIGVTLLGGIIGAILARHS